MAAPFVPNQNVDSAIAEEAPGHIFDTGIEPWIGQAGALDFLQICSLSPGQANGCITREVFDEMIYFAEIRPDEVQGIGKSIMAATTAAIRRN